MILSDQPLYKELYNLFVMMCGNVTFMEIGEERRTLIEARLAAVPRDGEVPPRLTNLFAEMLPTFLANYVVPDYTNTPTVKLHYDDLGGKLVVEIPEWPDTIEELTGEFYDTMLRKSKPFLQTLKAFYYASTNI